MNLFLIIVSVLLFLAGILQLSQATLGVGLICSACFFGIMARINQADKHQEKLSGQVKNIYHQISDMGEDEK